MVEEVFGVRKKISEIANVHGGYSATRAQLSKEGYCYLHYGDIHSFDKMYIDVVNEKSSIPKLHVDINRISKESLLQDGDVIFVDASEDIEGTTKHVVIRNSSGEVYISGLHTIIVRCFGKDINKGYLEYCFQTKDVRNQFRYYASGTKVMGINKKNIKNIEIVLPNMEEQQAIAEALSDIDNLIIALEKLIRKKKAIKQGTMQELLTGKRRLDGFEGEWDITQLVNLCYIITKQTGFDYTSQIKPSLEKVKKASNIPFVQNKDFKGKNVNLDTDFYIPIEVASSYDDIMLNEKCLLISISGCIGNVGMYDSGKLAFIGGAVGIAKFKEQRNIEWVMLYLLSKEGQKQIIRNEKAGAQHNITVEDIRRLNVPLPRIEEQNEICTLLFNMDSEITSLESKLSKYRQTKQGMMQELLTGRIRLV